MSAAEGGRTGVTDHAEPAPNPAGQEADKAVSSVPQVDTGVIVPAAKDFDVIAGTLPSNARSDDGNDAIVIHGPVDVKGDILYQAIRGENPRGWFRVLPDGTYEIGRTDIGDLSTFVHEPAHAYLKIIGDLAKREDASESLKDDYQKILDFLGAKDGEPFTREQQETWAGSPVHAGIDPCYGHPRSGDSH